MRVYKVAANLEKNKEQIKKAIQLCSMQVITYEE